MNGNPGWQARFIVSIALGTLGSLATAQCSSDWTPGFGQTGLSGGVHGLEVCDLGNGPELFAGGGFTRENGQFVNRIARWTGAAWAPLGLGFNGEVLTLASANLGTGTRLYAGGIFTQVEGVVATCNVASWSGTAWSQMTSNGALGGSAGLKVWPGSPARLYGISGHMLSVTYGGPWTPVASVTLTESLYALEVFDDGTGPHVYVAGSFVNVGGVPMNRVAKWTGSSWAPLGTGMDNVVTSLAVYDDGNGPQLYAGGLFSTAGGVAANGIAKWNGQSWSPVGGGANNTVSALSVRDWGLGPRLLVSGLFTHVGAGVPANHIASWDGSSWSAFGAGFGPISPGLETTATAFAVLNTGSGPSLVAGGGFVTAGGKAMNYVARWDGADWHPMPGGNGVNLGDQKWVKATAVFDDGTGPALYIAGRFRSVGDVASPSSVHTNIARFDGKHWSALGGGIPGDVNALTVYDDGTGPALYAGGFFAQAGNVNANYIAKWDGSQWSPLGSGLGGICDALEAPTTGLLAGWLVAGGTFQSAGGVPATYVAFWNGSSWSSTAPFTATHPPPVSALKYYDDGTGPALYAGGQNSLGPLIYKLAGTDWLPMNATFSAVYDFAVFDAGAGPRLYAAGSTSLGSPSYCLAELTSTGWVQVPGSPPTTAVRSLAVHPDSSGPALYLGGETSVAGSPPAYLARWDGNTFSSLGAGVGGLPGLGNVPPFVHTLESYDDGSGPALWVGGTFTLAGSHQSTLIARWAPPRPGLEFSQSTPGALSITNTWLQPGLTYHNVFSLEPCGLVGTGPYLGLCAADPGTLLGQYLLPLGTLPFHFTQASQTQVFGPYLVPAGLTVDGLSFGETAGVLGCPSIVKRWTTQ